MIAEYTENTCNTLPLRLMPAFYPAILPTDTAAWNELQNNYKFEFRNLPHEFHNGGTWAMTNGWLGAAFAKAGYTAQAQRIATQIDYINAQENWGFYENFNTQTQQPIGTKYCAWSAAAHIIINGYLNNNTLIL
jgi:glycogen debranching enzyme